MTDLCKVSRNGPRRHPSEIPLPKDGGADYHFMPPATLMSCAARSKGAAMSDIGEKLPSAPMCASLLKIRSLKGTGLLSGLSQQRVGPLQLPLELDAASTGISTVCPIRSTLQKSLA